MQDRKETTGTISKTKNKENFQAKEIGAVQVSITNAEDSVNEAETLKFCIGLINSKNEPVLALKEVAINVICTGTAANGDEYIGSSIVIIPSGSNSTDFYPFTEKYLKAEQIDKLTIALTAIKESGFADITIDPKHNFVELAAVDYQQDCFSVTALTVDGIAGVVEFTVSLSRAPITQEALVDYFLGRMVTADISSYRVDSGTLAFSPGITSHTVTQSFSDIDYKQCNSNFEVVLTNSINAQIKDSSEWAYKRHDPNTQPDTQPNLALVSIVESRALSVDSNDLNCEMQQLDTDGGSFAIELRDNKGELNVANTDVTVEVHYWGTMTDETDFVGKTSLIVPANSASFDFDIATLDEYIVKNSEAVNIELSQVYGGGFKAIVIDQNKSAAADASIRDIG